MFSGIRLRLTLLYLAAGGLLVLAVALSAYGLASYYFQRSTERALEHVMAEHFELLQAPLPATLADAEEAWYSGASGLLPARVSEALLPYLPEGALEGGEGPAGLEIHESPGEYALDADLAAIFVLALDEEGRLLPGFNTEASPLPPNQEAVERALDEGHDWRTVQADGIRIRLLTYRVTGLDEPHFLQVGRSLSDHDRLLQALVLGLFIVGGITMVALASASWWLAGRSLAPMEEAWRRQQGFMANASHELRAPLTLIQSSAEVALRELPEGSSEASLVRDILIECDHMSRLLEDQLLLSRLDAEELALTLQPVRLGILAEQLIRQVGRLPEATEREVQIEVDGEHMILGDPTRLRQVLLILLDNALRHTEAGDTIRLLVGRDGQWITVRVQDTGEGIPQEDLPWVADRFYRVDQARSRSEGRSGLGLAIAKSLVEAHRGTLEIESEGGTGTEVILQFPSMPRSDDSAEPNSVPSRSA